MEKGVVQETVIKDFTEETGKVAGAVWKYISENNGCTTAAQLRAKLLISNSLLFSAIGWLLREDKIVVQEKDKNFFVTLK
ncbi:winged helix-turn-helix domain-containing protein [bacterium]